MPRAPVLVPSWMSAPPSTGSLAVESGSRGRTLRPGDPELQPESLEEQSERLTEAITSSLVSGQLMFPLIPLEKLTEPDESDVPTFEYRARLIGLY